MLGYKNMNEVCGLDCEYSVFDTRYYLLSTFNLNKVFSLKITALSQKIQDGKMIIRKPESSPKFIPFPWILSIIEKNLRIDQSSFTSVNHVDTKKVVLLLLLELF